MAVRAVTYVESRATRPRAGDGARSIAPAPAHPAALRRELARLRRMLRAALSEELPSDYYLG